MLFNGVLFHSVFLDRALLASIPSPHTGVVHIGPLQLHMYGLTLLVTRVAVWGVAFGVLGARLYHDVTSWGEVPNPKWQGIWEVWKGGLGVWGGIFLGALVGSVIVRRAGANVGAFLDAAAPGLLLAQGIGRIGNWWNQELYGKPTGLPWGLKIDPEHRAVAYFNHATFHPTFLYELIWDVVGVLVLLWIARRFTIRPPGLFALYIAWYCFGRFFEELLRIDPSHHIAGLRLNAWVSVILFVASVVYFVLHQRRARGRGPREPKREPRKKGPTMAIPRGRVR